MQQDRRQVEQLERDYTEAWCSRDPYHWTFTGTSAETGKWVRILGLEERTIGADGLIASSRGQYDEAEYDRQLREGAGTAA